MLFQTVTIGNYEVSFEKLFMLYQIPDPSIQSSLQNAIIMTSLNGNISRVTGPLWEEFLGHRWIPLTKTSDARLWYFLWSVPEQTVEETIKRSRIWDAIALIMTSL